jgi:hypothetical protein
VDQKEDEGKNLEETPQVILSVLYPCFCSLDPDYKSTDVVLCIDIGSIHHL